MAKTPEKSRILLVDDHPLFLEGLRQMIDRSAALEVCGEVADAPSAMKAIADLKPDLVIVDITLGHSNGLDLIKGLKVKYEDLPVLVISMHDESLYAERAIRAGARGRHEGEACPSRAWRHHESPRRRHLPQRENVHLRPDQVDERQDRSPRLSGRTT